MTRSSDPRQISLLPPDGATLLHLVRENLRLLAELVNRYEVGTLTLTSDERIVCRPADIAEYFGAELSALAQEQVRVVLLNTKNRIVGASLVCQGGLNATVIRLADLFREAIIHGAAGVILIHNHPSGDPRPSAADIQLTKDVAQVGDLLGIELMDHVIIGRGGHVSLRETGDFTPARRT